MGSTVYIVHQEEILHTAHRLKNFLVYSRDCAFADVCVSTMHYQQQEQSRVHFPTPSSHEWGLEMWDGMVVWVCVFVSGGGHGKGPWERPTHAAAYITFSYPRQPDALLKRREERGCVCRSEARRVGKECRCRWAPYH